MQSLILGQISLVTNDLHLIIGTCYAIRYLSSNFIKELKPNYGGYSVHSVQPIVNQY